jgi:hypothetical protein
MATGIMAPDAFTMGRAFDMATLADVATEHRSVAGRIKDLDKLPAEEARHRAAHVHQLERDSPLSGKAKSS